MSSSLHNSSSVSPSGKWTEYSSITTPCILIEHVISIAPVRSTQRMVVSHDPNLDLMLISNRLMFIELAIISLIYLSGLLSVSS